jgi:hypothetical protein
MDAVTYDMLVRDVPAWLESGAELLRGARALIRQTQVDQAWEDRRKAQLVACGDADGAEFLTPERAILLRPALLLSALGAEVGLKAVLALDLQPVPMPASGALDEQLRSHDLGRLATAAKIAPMDDTERGAINEGRQLIEWGARYPLPLRNAPIHQVFRMDYVQAYERLFLRCVERIAAEQYGRSPTRPAVPVDEWVKQHRARFEHAFGGISAPFPHEEAVVGLPD